MSQQNRFRPRFPESLEARAVPSLAGVTLATGIAGITVTVPAQVSPTNPQVQAAFAAFDQSYIRAVDALLASTGSNGLIVSTANRDAFVNSVEGSIATLAEQLVLSLNTSASTGSTSTATTQQLEAAIVGGATSLESQLLALSLAQIQALVPNASGTSGGAASTPVANVVTTAEQVRPTVRVPVAESVGVASFAATPGSTSTPDSPATKATDAVRSAFDHFLNTYFQAVQATLLAPGSDGRVDPAAHRAAFDARVGQSLASLQSSLATSLGRYPATSGLGSQIQSSIGGDGAASLKARLGQIATPQGAVVRDFTLGSTRAIAEALASLSGDVARLIGPAGR